MTDLRLGSQIFGIVGGLVLAMLLASSWGASNAQRLAHDHFRSQTQRSSVAPIPLVAGQRAEIRYKFFGLTGATSADLSIMWTPDSLYPQTLRVTPKRPSAFISVPRDAEAFLITNPGGIAEDLGGAVGQDGMTMTPRRPKSGQTARLCMHPPPSHPVSIEILWTPSTLGTLMCRITPEQPCRNIRIPDTAEQ